MRGHASDHFIADISVRVPALQTPAKLVFFPMTTRRTTH
jgi:hypothetical protein